MRRWCLILCVLPMLSGCVSLHYYEALREAYEKSEARNEDTKNELNRTRAELTQVQQQLLDRASSQEERTRLLRQLEAARAALLAKDEEMNRALQALRASLREEIAKGQSTVRRNSQGVNVVLAERILYESGSADVTQDGVRVLKRIAEALRGSPTTLIRVEGHTDNVPIRTDPPPRYSSNFELSFARAIGVARYFNEVAGVQPSRLSAMGLASTSPLVENIDDEARARNRRVEILVEPAR